MVTRAEAHAPQPTQNDQEGTRRRYVVAAAWTHIFLESARQRERMTRWVFDLAQNKLIVLDVQRDQKWRAADANEIADVEDSIKHANAEVLSNPSDWEADETDVLPVWN